MIELFKGYTLFDIAKNKKGTIIMTDKSFNQEIAQALVNTVLDKYLEPILSKFSSGIKDTIEKAKINTGITFESYLINSYDKYSKVKTIIYGIEPKELYNFFEVPFLNKGTDIIKPKSADDITKLSKFLIIQGTGGIGKSTLMKHVFLSSLELKKYIPIFIELKDFNDNGHLDLNRLLLTKLNQFHGEFEEQYLDYALQSGAFLFLLDGYDELYAENQKTFFQKLNEFCDKYPENHYILSSRPYSESEFIEFQRFTILQAKPFTKEQAIKLIHKIEYPDLELKHKFIQDLDKHLYDNYQSFASNPLLLNIMFSNYNDYAEIPKKLHLFYYQAFDTMFAKHDATKSYRREMSSNLSSDDFKKYFSIFCFLTYRKAKVEFTYSDIEEIFKSFPKTIRQSLKLKAFIDDLENCLCVLYKEGTKYKFTHRSFQEYFTAYFLNLQTDNKLYEFSISLIDSGKFSSNTDSVFFLLEDINQQRFNKIVLLPLIDEFESKLTNTTDKLHYYILNFPVNITVDSDTRSMRDFRINLSLPTVPKIRFIYNFYRETVDYSKYKSASDEELIAYCKSKSMLYQDIEANQIVGNKDLFQALNKSWVGKRIQGFSEYKNVLEQNIKDDDINLEELEL